MNGCKLCIWVSIRLPLVDLRWCMYSFCLITWNDPLCLGTHDLLEVCSIHTSWLDILWCWSARWWFSWFWQATHSSILTDSEELIGSSSLTTGAIWAESRIKWLVTLTARTNMLCTYYSISHIRYVLYDRIPSDASNSATIRLLLHVNS